MKIFIAFTLLCIFSEGQSQKCVSPKFTWIQTAEPVLQITYPNGVSDVVTLKKLNLQPGKRQENAAASCIYEGYMANEKDAYVSLAGCGLPDDFEVKQAESTA